MAFTTADLIASIKRRGTIPTAQSLFQDSTLCEFLTDELQTVIVPKIMSVREDYFLAYEDQAIAAENVYDIPERAIGMKLKDVVILDSQGNEIYKLPRIPLETSAGSGPIDFGRSTGFHIRNNQVVITPSTFTGGSSIRLYYYRRANDLVIVSAAGQISSIDSGASSVVLGNVPSTWSTGTEICVIKGKPGFDTKVESSAIVSVSSPTVVLSSVSDLSVGDWVCLKGESTIPQIPVEAHGVLAQAVTVKILEALGDREGMAVAQQKYMQLEEHMLTTLSPRVDGAPQKIVSNGSGLFDWNRHRRRGW